MVGTISNTHLNTALVTNSERRTWW